MSDIGVPPDTLETYVHLLNIQLEPGTWDDSPYMHGMLNGMIVMYQVANPNTHLKCKDAPEYWQSRWHRLFPRFKAFFKIAACNFISNVTGLEIDYERYYLDVMTRGSK